MAVAALNASPYYYDPGLLSRAMARSFDWFFSQLQTPCLRSLCRGCTVRMIVDQVKPLGRTVCASQDFAD